MRYRVLLLAALAASFPLIPSLAQPTAPSHPPAPHAAHRPAHALHDTRPHDTQPHDAHRHDARPAQAARPAPAKPAAEAPAPAVAPLPATPAEPPKGSVTGLPLPRFAALRSDDVDLRVGPGTRYPIQWVYKRRDLPVEIIREFEVWRLVQDGDGVKGWVHQATLTGRRTFEVTGAEATMRDAANDAAAPVARLKPGVVGRLRGCEAAAEWCRVQVGDLQGWLRRDAFWGIEKGEAIQ